MARVVGEMGVECLETDIFAGEGKTISSGFRPTSGRAELADVHEVAGCPPPKGRGIIARARTV